MKTLSLLRHAEAENASGALPGNDHARALTARGRAQAQDAAIFMKAHGLRPELVVCSDAARTAETARLLHAALADSAIPAPRAEKVLYLIQAPALLSFVYTLPPGVSHALIVAHNPGVAEAAGYLAGDAAQDALRGFSPATLASFTLDVDDWNDVDPSLVRDVRCHAPQ
jgi:phosphohistidine phosphatase